MLRMIELVIGMMRVDIIGLTEWKRKSCIAKSSVDVFATHKHLVQISRLKIHLGTESLHFFI